MAKPKSTTKKRTITKGKVSKEERAKARAYADQELMAIGDPGLYWEHNGRFCYVFHHGAPLGRLGYKGELQEWDFAIYKYSTGKYSSTSSGPASGNSSNEPPYAT